MWKSQFQALSNWKGQLSLRLADKPSAFQKLELKSQHEVMDTEKWNQESIWDLGNGSLWGSLP